MYNRFPCVALIGFCSMVLAPLATQAADDKKLEVFSWWPSGGESAALEALFATYKKQDPAVEVLNSAVAGGGGSNARPVLQTRLAGGSSAGRLSGESSGNPTKPALGRRLTPTRGAAAGSAQWAGRRVA